MAERIRAAVVGTTWGERALVPAIGRLPEMELAAVGTAHADTAAAMAARTGAPKAYGDFAQLVQDPDIDLVAIAVRPALHHPLTEMALKAGKHVYCEWPSGLSVAQVDDLRQLAERQKRTVVVGLQARWSPVVMQLRRLMDEGYIGDLLSFSFTQLMSQYNRPTPSARWWTTRKEEGGTALTLAGGAVFDILSWAIGQPVELAASVDVQMKQWTWSDTGATVDVTSPDTIAVSARLANGGVGAVTISRVAWHGTGQRLELYGTQGSLQLGLVYNAEIKGRRLALMGGGTAGRLAELPVPDEFYFTPEVSRDDPHLPVAQSLRQMCRAIRSGEPAEPDLRTSVRVHRILAAIQQASEKRRWVQVGE